MNKEEFTILIKGEQAQLRRFLLALCCGNADDADDIAQESLVKAYLSCEGYKESGRLTSWIYKIAYNTFLDRHKSRVSHQSLEYAYELADNSSSADDAFRYQELYNALKQIPPKERSAILLYYISGYSIREISRITEASEDAVKKQLSRGREHLKELLKL